MTIISFSLSACVLNPTDEQNEICLKIKRELHIGPHRHWMGSRITAIKRAKLMKEAQMYHCDIDYTDSGKYTYPPSRIPGNGTIQHSQAN